MARRQYIIAIDAETPPIDGSNGDILEVLSVGVGALKHIRDKHPHDNKAVDNIVRLVLVALTHSMALRHTDLGTPEKPILVDTTIAVAE